MSRARRESVGDWTMVVAAVLLFVSLFLVWSHQLSPAIVRRYGATGVFDGVPPSPDAWQVYTTVDVLLTLLAVALVTAALWGNRPLRLVLAAAVVIGLVFVVHALGTPPTNGADLFDPHTGRYLATGAGAGPGEVLALAALALAGAGLALSLTSDL